MSRLRELGAATLISAAMLALAACGDSPQMPAAIIQTPQGPVQGVTTDNPMITNFKGLPFAARTVWRLIFAAEIYREKTARFYKNSPSWFGFTAAGINSAPAIFLPINITAWRRKAWSW